MNESHYVTNVLGVLVSYIGYPATIFLGSLLVLVIVRIGFAFVFKIFKMNLDYDRFNKK